MSSTILNAQVFERLFDEKYDQLYYFAYDFLNDAEAAKDIVSDVFADIWRKRERLITSSLNSYLYICVKSRCLDHLRLVRRQDEASEEFLHLSRQGEDEEWDEREERIRRLEKEIEKLPERTQLMLKEKYFNGRSYQELADILGISPNGVKMMVTRTYSLLRERLEVTLLIILLIIMLC